VSARRFDRWHLGAERLARALLGQTLVRVVRGRRLAGRIVETEAYLGGDDLGSHSAGGRRTLRNESMFLPGGHAYIYFVYGMHHCFNIVASPMNTGCAVLVRAIEPIDGCAGMAKRRGLAWLPGSRHAAIETKLLRALASGPARLCAALAIDRRLDGEDLTKSKRLFIERAPAVDSRRIVRGARVGIPYAGKWQHAALRFAIADHPCISRPFAAP